jgi:hypothetical protein
MQQEKGMAHLITAALGLCIFFIAWGRSLLKKLPEPLFICV